MNSLCSVSFDLLLGDPAKEQQTLDVYARSGLDGVGVTPQGARSAPSSISCVLYGTYLECKAAEGALTAAVGTAGRLTRTDACPLDLPIFLLAVSEPDLVPIGLPTKPGATHRLALTASVLHDPTEEP